MKTVFLILLLANIAHIAQAVTISEGRSFDIAEPDLLIEIQEKAKNITLPTKPLELDITYLPIAQEADEYYFKPIFKLPFDIKIKNKILYRKGYEFNPLKYKKLQQKLLIVGHPSHLETLKKSVHYSADHVILVANMSVHAFIEKTLKIAYLFDENAKKRLGVKLVPSLVTQENDQFLIQVFAPEESL